MSASPARICALLGRGLTAPEVAARLMVPFQAVLRVAREMEAPADPAEEPTPVRAAPADSPDAMSMDDRVALVLRKLAAGEYGGGVARPLRQRRPDPAQTRADHPTRR